MNCMKCGRELEPGEVFCESCRETMGKYPVKPDTIVQLPSRPEGQPLRKPQRHKRVLSSEERILQLHRKSRRLTAGLMLALLLIGILSFGIGALLSELDFQRFLGQNYTTIETTETEPETESVTEPSEEASETEGSEAPTQAEE